MRLLSSRQSTVQSVSSARFQTVPPGRFEYFTYHRCNMQSDTTVAVNILIRLIKFQNLSFHFSSFKIRGTKLQKTPDNPSRSSGIYEIFAERLFLYHFLTINDIYTLVLGFCFKLSTIQIIPDIIFDFILQNGRYTSRYWITFC